jgi:hypothetical protein
MPRRGGSPRGFLVSLLPRPSLERGTHLLFGVPRSEGRMGGRSARSVCMDGLTAAHARRYFGPSPLRLSQGRAPDGIVAANGRPWVFQPRRGGCRTPEVGTVTPTAKLAPVAPGTFSPAIPSAMASRIPQAPLPSRVVRRSREPRAPLGKERGEYRPGAGERGYGKTRRSCVVVSKVLMRMGRPTADLASELPLD